MCINHHTNSDPVMFPVRAIGCRYVHIMANNHKPETFLSAYWIDGDKYDVTDADI